VKPGEVVVAKTRARLLSSDPHGRQRQPRVPAGPARRGHRALLRGRDPPAPRLRQARVIAAAAPSWAATTSCWPHRRRAAPSGSSRWPTTWACRRVRLQAAARAADRHRGHRACRPTSRASVVIYDDMIRTGGSLIGAARAYRDAGAATIDACRHPRRAAGPTPPTRLRATGPVRAPGGAPTATPAPTRAQRLRRGRVDRGPAGDHVPPTADLLSETRNHHDEAHPGRRHAVSTRPRSTGTATAPTDRPGRHRRGARRWRHAAVPARAGAHRLRLRGHVLHARAAGRGALDELLEARPAVDAGMVVAFGVPIYFEKALYNCAALLVDGALVGLRGQALPGRRRHPLRAALVQALAGTGRRDVIEHGDQRFPIGDLLFDVGGVRLGFEICEDAWVANARARACRCAASTSSSTRRPATSRSASAVRQRFVIEGSRAFGVSVPVRQPAGQRGRPRGLRRRRLIASGGELLARGRRFGFGDLELSTAVIDVDGNRARSGAAGIEPPAPRRRRGRGGA
jgi:predicted amidohydrolase